MKLVLIFFTLSCITDTSTQTNHFYIQLSGCSASDKEFVVEHDGDEILHSDFNKHGLVMKIPDFADPIEWHGGYEYSVIEQDACKHNLDFAIKAFKNPSEALDAPQSSIYPRDDVHLGSNSTLVCFSTRFFPPPVRIRWTRNGLNVTDESTLNQYYPNKDNTYNQFSHLPFTPQEGDVYTCTVEHKALQIPKTITWGPAVFCGLGLAVGLLGVATGTFFVVKGNQCY